jgi:hypothetical protein
MCTKTKGKKIPYKSQINIICQPWLHVSISADLLFPQATRLQMRRSQLTFFPREYFEREIGRLKTTNPFPSQWMNEHAHCAINDSSVNISSFV